MTAAVTTPTNPVDPAGPARRRREARGTSLRLAVAGLWFRRSTTVIVLVLATVASAAAVVAPLYARAAEESILRATLSRTSEFSRSVQLAVPLTGGGTAEGPATNPEFAVGQVRSVLKHPAFGTPRVAYNAPGQYAPTAGDFAGGEVDGPVVERAGVCRHVRLAAGRCPAKPGEGLFTRRSLALVGAKIGDTIEVTLKESTSLETGGIPPVLPVTVVGAFDPVPVDSTYWVGRPYFSSYYPKAVPVGANGEKPPTADPVFVGKGSHTRAHITTYTIDIPVRPSQVRLDDPEVLRRQVRRLTDSMAVYLLTTESQLPSALARADEGRDLVRIAAPLAVTQLVLLSWWTLYLVVGSATEERSPELGLAKLRGLTVRQTRRFGLAEVFLLLLVAAPVGTVVGYLAVSSAAGRVFAPGTQVVLTWSVLLTVLGTLAGGVVTAALSSRQVFRRPVSELLRRVPPRRAGRKAGLIEGVVLVLAVAGVAQLVSERGERPSPVALLAPGMIAVAGGLLAARLLVRVARRRTSAAMIRGRASGAAGWAGVARRPGTARIASVLAVAACLLIVGVQAWTVAERNRFERSAAETGAEVVLQVRAPDDHALVDAVRRADPSGSYAMAAVQVTSSGQDPELLAVDAARADDVMAWGDPNARPHQPLRTTLRPELPAPIRLEPGRIAVTAELRQVNTPSPLHLWVRLSDRAGSDELDLGQLRLGRHTYSADLPPGCVPADCSLAALAVNHPATDIENATAILVVHSVGLAPAGGGPAEPIVDSFTSPDAWRAGAPTVGGPQVVLEPGRALRARITAPGGPDAEIVHGDSPEPLPALVGPGAGGLPPEEGGLPVGTTTGLGGAPTRYLTAHTAPFIPRSGETAVLVDIGLAMRLSTENTVGDQEVWLSRDDPSAERALRAELKRDRISVLRREARGDLERVYAGDGAVLALRLLLVCGAAAVVVAVGALLVAAYVGRRQRAYEVAALRVIGMRRRTVRSLLLRENVGTVVVALLSGALAALVATWVVLPALPQFDEPSDFVAVRYAPDAASAWTAIAGLGLLLVAVGLAVAMLQLRSGRADRLREGVR